MSSSEKFTIRHALELQASSKAIQAALTTAAGIHGWWASDAEIGEGQGSEHILRFVKGEQTVTMKFRVDRDAPGEVAWTCTDNGNPVWPGTTLRWKWQEEGDGARLVFEHAGFAEAASPPYQMTVGGWEHFIGSLRSYLETGEGQPS